MPLSRKTVSSWISFVQKVRPAHRSVVSIPCHHAQVHQTNIPCASRPSEPPCFSPSLTWALLSSPKQSKIGPRPKCGILIKTMFQAVTFSSFLSYTLYASSAAAGAELGCFRIFHISPSTRDFHQMMLLSPLSYSGSSQDSGMW